MDGGDWQAAVHGIAELDMTEWTSLTHMLCPLLLEPSSHLPSHPTPLGCHRTLV